MDGQAPGPPAPGGCCGDGSGGSVGVPWGKYVDGVTDVDGLGEPVLGVGVALGPGVRVALDPGVGFFVPGRGVGVRVAVAVAVG